MPSEEIEKARRRIQELDQSIATILDNHCDPSMGPIQELAAETRHLLISKCQELICPAKEQPEACEPLSLGPELSHARRTPRRSLVLTAYSRLAIPTRGINLTNTVC